MERSYRLIPSGILMAHMENCEGWLSPGGHSSGGRALTTKVRGPQFNPGWLPVFHSSLKIFPSLSSCTFSAYVSMHIHVNSVIETRQRKASTYMYASKPSFPPSLPPFLSSLLLPLLSPSPHRCVPECLMRLCDTRGDIRAAYSALLEVVPTHVLTRYVRMQV